jgi:hypothetical protein
MNGQAVPVRRAAHAQCPSSARASARRNSRSARQPASSNLISQIASLVVFYPPLKRGIVSRRLQQKERDNITN